MKKIFILLFITIVTFSFAIGCGQNGDVNQGVESNENREMIVGIPKITDSFDFYNTANGFETVSMAQIYETLVIKDSTGKTVPHLAESYSLSEDGMKYIFNLRKDVKFTNGRQFTAKDAKYSIDEAMSSPWTSWCYTSVDSCEIVDEYTIAINMKKPSVSLLEFLANPYYCAMLSEETVKEFGDQFGKSVETTVGTGPYILTEWKPGEYCAYEANPDYFKGEPAIKKVRLKAITDVNAAVIGLQTGEIHAYFNDIPGISFEDISNNENITLVTYPSTIFFEIIMNTENGIFADKTMRQAVAYAVDREQMLIVGAEGLGAVADYPGDREGYTVGNPGIKTWYEHDLEKAKELVKSAGMEGQKVTIKTYATEPYPRLATVLQDTLTRIGLDASVLQMERGAFIDEALTKGEYEIGICRWAAGTKDMDEIMFGSLATDSIGASGNWSWYSNPIVDELLEKAAGEPDEEVRKQLYAQVIEIYTEDVPQVPLFYPDGSRAFSNELVCDKGNAEYDRFFDYAWRN